MGCLFSRLPSDLSPCGVATTSNCGVLQQILTYQLDYSMRRALHSLDSVLYILVWRISGHISDFRFSTFELPY